VGIRVPILKKRKKTKDKNNLEYNFYSFIKYGMDKNFS